MINERRNVSQQGILSDGSFLFLDYVCLWGPPCKQSTTSCCLQVLKSFLLKSVFPANLVFDICDNGTQVLFSLSWLNHSWHRLLWFCIFWSHFMPRVKVLFVWLTSSFWLLQVDELLKQRDSIHASFTVTRTVSYLSNGSTSKLLGDDSKAGSPVEDGISDGKDKSSKKKWFNLSLKGSEKK